MSCEPGTCGVGGWAGPVPGDPGNNSILSATPAFGGIDVSWTFPTTNPFAVAHTKLYRGTSADFGTAILIGDMGGTFHYDKLDSGLTYWYWIQFVANPSGNIGELIGPASATAKPTIQGMLELLTEQIDLGVLAISLRTEIARIETLNLALLGEVTARENG